MNFKKKITTFILIAFGILQFQPIFAKTFEIEEGTLQEFLKTTEDIKVAYNWTQENTNRSLGQTIILPAGTPITIRSLSTIKSSEIKSGDIVKFTVNSDVKNREGYTIIKAGADVSAEIVFSKEKGKIGKSGILKISNFHTRAVDGSYIPLSATLSSEPEDNMVTSILLSVFICPLFLLLEGDDASISAGRTQISYTHSDVYIDKRAVLKQRYTQKQNIETNKPSYQTPNITVE